ncbi:MAG: hypothetical protein ACRCYQ_10465 [Nocardioides sp.]
MRTCSACRRIAPAQFLVCGLCWRRLPQPLRTELSRSWHRWRRDLYDLDQFDVYRAARRDVLAFLTRPGAR